jgi:tRNA nucleotidyltransferase/poly(A) polymerase
MRAIRFANQLNFEIEQIPYNRLPKMQTILKLFHNLESVLDELNKKNSIYKQNPPLLKFYCYKTGLLDILLPGNRIK